MSIIQVKINLYSLKNIDNNQAFWIDYKYLLLIFGLQMTKKTPLMKLKIKSPNLRNLLKVSNKIKKTIKRRLAKKKKKSNRRNLPNKIKIKKLK